MTLVVALAGGHGNGLIAWARGNLGSLDPERWDWKKAGVTLVCALLVWAFAVATGHTVEDVGGALLLDENGWAVMALVYVANNVVATGIKWWTTGDPRPAAPPAGGGSA